MVKQPNVAFKIKVPNFKQFCTKKNDSPLVLFYVWLLAEMGQPAKSKKFRLDVSSVMLDKDTAKDFKDQMLKWAMKLGGSENFTKNVMGWEWLDIGPNEFYDKLPEWAEPGYIYVLKTWKKKADEN